MPSPSINQPLRNNNFDLSRGATVWLLAGFGAVILYALFTNSPCLFFDWDGMNQAVVMDYFEQFTSSFKIAMVDPLQGMFDIYFQAYRGALPQMLVMKVLGYPGLHKIFFHASCDLALALAVYALGVATGLNRLVSLLATFLFAALTLPLFSFTGYLDNLFSISPSHTYVIAISTMVIALIWNIDGRTWSRTTLFTLLIILMLISAAWSFVFLFSTLAPIVIAMGFASLFADRGRSALTAKLAAGTLTAAALLAAGIPNYLYALGSSMAQQYFPMELMYPTVAVEGWASDHPLTSILLVLAKWIPFIFVHMGSPQWIMTVGVLGAFVASVTAKKRKFRVFAVSYLVVCGLYAATLIVTSVYWPWLTGHSYRGPTLHRVVHFISPIGILFVSYLIVMAAQFIVSTAMIAVSASRRLLRNDTDPTAIDRQSVRLEHRIAGYSLLLAALVVPAALAATNNPGSSQKRCTLPYFSPLERAPIIDYLAPRIGLDIGSSYNGSVATLTGVRKQENLVWVDNVTADLSVWARTGNDLHTIGLWQYRIPTLFQANTAMTAQYFLTVTEFLSEPADRQTRTFAGITRANEKIMSLWGVRFVIADRPLSFGTQRLLVETGLGPPLNNSAIRLYELAEPNLGNYSPTEIISANDTAETMAAMTRPDFDPKRMVVTNARLHGEFMPARASSMTVIDGGLVIRAVSAGESILVLPVQYSHCWVAGPSQQDSPLPTFFRANLMQLGIRFSGRLSATIKYEFGPFWHSHCRLEDGRDVERLKMTAVRRAPG